MPVVDAPSGRRTLFGGGSTARGVAVLAWLALALVGARALRGCDRVVDGNVARAVCDAPLEIRDSHGVRLGCAGARSLRDCLPTPRVGDRVLRDDGVCRVAHSGMGAPARLLVGLSIDVNRASRADLQLIRGIGPSLAAAIIAERQQGGEFTSVDDLQRVRGIGPKSVERFRSRLGIEPATDDDNGDD